MITVYCFRDKFTKLVLRNDTYVVMLGCNKIHKVRMLAIRLSNKFGYVYFIDILRVLLCII